MNMTADAPVLTDAWTKLVGYAYPSSPIAKRFGHGATGCYFVATHAKCANGDPREVIVSAHAGEAGKAHARIACATLPYAWSRYTM